MVATLGADQHISGIGTVSDLDVGGILVLIALVEHFRTADQLGFLHAGDIVEVDFLGDRRTVLGDGLVVVGHFLALIDERFADGLAAHIKQNRRDFEGGLREEVLRREGHGNGGVDVAGDNFQDFRIALDVDLFGGIDHFLCLVAGCQGEGKDCDKQQVRN